MASSGRQIVVPGPGRHVPALDGVRGIAILLVLLHHFTYYGRMHSLLAIDFGVERLLRTGWLGVDLFFVLSGFLITGILADTRDDPRYFRTFYARRALRILPLYYATLVAWFWLMPLVIEPPRGFDEHFGEQWLYWVYVINIDIAMNGWPAVNHLAHFWSLAIEEQFYLVWPIVVIFAPRRRLMAICAGCIGGALVLRLLLLTFDIWGGSIYVSTPCRVDQLAAGGLVALWLRGGVDRRVANFWARGFLAVGGLGCGLIFARKAMLDPSDPLMSKLGYTLTGLIGCGLVLLAVSSRPGSLASRVLSWGPLRAAGRYSYGLYVVHHPIVLLLSKRGVRASYMPEIWDSRLPSVALIALFAGLVSLIVAMASWHLMEAPILRLKKYARYGTPRAGPETRAARRMMQAVPESGSAGRFVNRSTPLSDPTLLVLAPHMDDEALACGGTIALHDDPRRVHVLFLTDGARSPAYAFPRRGAPRELPAVRVAEARRAAAELGVPHSNLRFGGYPDGNLAGSTVAAAALLEATLDETGAQVVLAPFRYDRHPDHLAANRVAHEVLSRRGGATRLVEYFVYWRWRTVPGGDVRECVAPERRVSVEIARGAARKRAALECYVSQVTRYFPWQSRPVLTAQSLDEACRGPEQFCLAVPGEAPGAALSRLRRLVPIAHRLETPAKRVKDALLAPFRRRPGPA